MQLAAVRRPRSEERLKEPHRGRHDERHAPARGEHPLLVLQLRLAVILQHIGHNIPVDLRALLREREERQHDNHALHAPPAAVAQRKVQHGQRLARARRRGERIQPARAVARVPALLKERVSQPVDPLVGLGFAPERRHVRIKAFKQRLRVQALPFRARQEVRLLVHRRCGVVRIHQAGKEHTGSQHAADGVFRFFRYADSKIRLSHLLAVRPHGALIRRLADQRGGLARVARCRSLPGQAGIKAFAQRVGTDQPVVVAVDRLDHRRVSLAFPHACPQRSCARNRVIDARPLPAQHRLKGLAVLAEVVKGSRKPRLVPHAHVRAERFRQRHHCAQVLRHRGLSPVVEHRLGIIRHNIPPCNKYPHASIIRHPQRKHNSHIQENPRSNDRGDFNMPSACRRAPVRWRRPAHRSTRSAHARCAGRRTDL